MTSKHNASQRCDVHVEASDTLRCSRCTKPYQRVYWSSYERGRHQKLGTSLVCKHCRCLGFHPRDLQAYTCQRCRGSFGAGRFRSTSGAKYIPRCQLLKEKSLCKQCLADCVQCFNCLQYFDVARHRTVGLNRRRGGVLCNGCGGLDLHRQEICIASTLPCDARLPCAKCKNVCVGVLVFS